MATMFDYDLAIIGGGSAGLTAAKVARFFAQLVIAFSTIRAHERLYPLSVYTLPLPLFMTSAG